jgi:ArsR family transcriptional regulator
LCDEQIVHVDAVRGARAHLPDPDRIAAMSALFGALGDPTRLRVVAALASQELCVCDLAATLGMSPSSVSHQLRALRALGLVASRRDGRLVYYALDDAHVSSLFDQALEHVNHINQTNRAMLA